MIVLLRGLICTRPRDQKRRRASGTLFLATASFWLGLFVLTKRDH